MQAETKSSLLACERIQFTRLPNESSQVYLSPLLQAGARLEAGTGPANPVPAAQALDLGHGLFQESGPAGAPPSPSASSRFVARAVSGVCSSARRQEQSSSGRPQSLDPARRVIERAGQQPELVGALLAGPAVRSPAAIRRVVSGQLRAAA
jgi:hypothetical protein